MISRYILQSGYPKDRLN